MPARPHVGLNALFLDPGRSAGTETYLRGLVRALATEFPQLARTIFTTRRGAAALRADGWGDLARIVHFPFDEGQRPRRLLAEALAVVAAAHRRGVDVLHSLASTGPAWPLTRSVITLHDVTFLRLRTFRAATTVAMRATCAFTTSRDPLRGPYGARLGSWRQPTAPPHPGPQAPNWRLD